MFRIQERPPLNNEVLIANLSGRGTVDQKEVEMSTENLVQRCPQVPPNPASPPRRGSGNQERRLHNPPYDPCNSSPAGGEGAIGIRRKSGGGRCRRQTSPGKKEDPIPQREELLEGESLMSHPASTMARDLSQRGQSQRQRDGTSLGALRAEMKNLAAIKREYQLYRRVGNPKVETGVAPANLANQAGAASASPACLSLSHRSLICHRAPQGHSYSQP